MPDATAAEATEPAAAAPTAGAEDRRLADDLDALLKHADGKPISVGEVMQVLSDRGHAVLILLLAGPFVFIPIPGLSTAFGLALIILGGCVMLGVKPWLPNFICRRQIRYELLTKIVHGVERVLKWVEKIAKPRLGFMTHRGMNWASGLTLISLAFLFALPIPIPGNNIPPALGMVIVAFGLLERDGLLVLVGHAYNLILIAVLFLAGNLLWRSIQVITDKLGWTQPATQHSMLDLLDLWNTASVSVGLA
jgi:hypothetical protein